MAIVQIGYPSPMSEASSSNSIPISNRADFPHGCPDLYGEVHFFHRLWPSLSTSNPTTDGDKTTFLFIPSVPLYMSREDFIEFCGTFLGNFTQIQFIGRDLLEQSVVLKMINPGCAYDLRDHINGRRFHRLENDVCHVFYAEYVNYMESSILVAVPPPGFTELPICSVCLERLDQFTTGIKTTLCDHYNACSCMSDTKIICEVCGHLFEGVDLECSVCGKSEWPWICLVCGVVGCSRSEEGHAFKHWEETRHNYGLFYLTGEIWDYAEGHFAHRLRVPAPGDEEKAEEYSDNELEDCFHVNDSSDSDS